jgi:hypothetical protein
MVGIKDGRAAGAWQVYSPISLSEWNKFLEGFNVMLAAQREPEG